MTYTPKHRGEPVVKFRVHYMESERGWGQDYFESDFDTMEEAQAAFDDTNSKLTERYAPDYYIKALKIERVVL